MAPFQAASGPPGSTEGRTNLPEWPEHTRSRICRGEMVPKKCRGRSALQRKSTEGRSQVPNDPGSEPDPGIPHLQAPRSKMPHFQPHPGKEDLWEHNLRLHHPLMCSRGRTVVHGRRNMEGVLDCWEPQLPQNSP